MRRNCRMTGLAGALAALGACLLTAGCHIAVNLPADPTGDPASAPGNPVGTAPAEKPQAVQQMTYSVPVRMEQSADPAPGPDGPGVIRADLTDPGTAPPAAGDVQPCGLTGHARPACAGPAGPPCGGPACTTCSVCAACAAQACPAPIGSPYGPIPRELDKVSLPDYIIEPPDVLTIDTVRGAPLPPYHIEPLDALQLKVANALPNEPISGVYVVEPEGTVNLGLSYGAVPVAGLTLEQARAAVTDQLKRVLTGPQVVVALAQTRGLQPLVRGEHLVKPDGTISLGVYGCVYVAGLNLCQAREAIEHALARFLVNPQVALDVRGFNSKVYYVIFDGGGYGQQVYRLPITGNETVLDAIGLLNGLPAVSSKKKIWVARPAPAECGCDQVLPVDWNAITQGGSTATNYQLLPGDRVYVKADPWVCFDNSVAKVITPFQRAFGLTLLSRWVVNINNNGCAGATIAP